jgi:hypothetical protein
LKREEIPRKKKRPKINVLDMKERDKKVSSVKYFITHRESTRASYLLLYWGMIALNSG